MDPVVRSRLAQRLREHRLAQGLRQSDLAIPGQVSRSAVSALERGQLQNPSRRLVTAIARQLGLGYEDLVGVSTGEARILDLLREAQRLQPTLPSRALVNAQRALILSRRLNLGDAEATALTTLGDWHDVAGDSFGAALYTAGSLVPRAGRRGDAQAELLRLGLRLHRLGEWRAEASLYRDFILGLPATHRRSARVYLQLGTVYGDLNRHAHAGRMLKRAYRDSTAMGQVETSALALLGLARALACSRRLLEAARIYAHAARIAATYPSRALQTNVRRTGEVLDLLASPSLRAGREQWEAMAGRLHAEASSLDDQASLYRYWISYAADHRAWSEVRAAADAGLALLSTRGASGNRGLKGQFLWARAHASHQTGQEWQRDLAWATDLLRLNLRPALDGPPFLMPLPTR